ncbi:hypothetical protein CMUS01_15096 [Colletotrichum musicola]|uniref:DUF2264 domain-containing protein n=1 Tax=Colletotrichum musicola TaxID=2175873 RepID=A0A8H6MPE0_9PEZI|nr:hypothetical protein CMUS01_15096 [Colletotrichum musicola]
MPSLPGFSDNPLCSREDVVAASRALIAPLLPYFSPAQARVRIPETIGTHFDETAAQLEGFARPLFVVGALLHACEPVDDILRPWVNGFEAGTDPDHDEFWGTFDDRDQRMVEAEIVAFGLLAGQQSGLWDRFDERIQSNIKGWLLGIMGKEFHASNWLWFRVMSAIALIKVCSADSQDVRDQMESDFRQLDGMYLRDGWSSDGTWPDDQEVLGADWKAYQETGKANQRFWSRQADYYSGSFAIQFSQLLYVKFAADLDPVRAEKYRQEARDFGSQFWRYFDADGAAIPFGRSLTYRFACAGFFAALAFAEVDMLPDPLGNPGSVKGYLLRHLRWWTKRSDGIFRSDGTLNLGWTYSNMFLTEDYNSPQSVYWALKSFVVVGLAADKPFWTETEAAYPQSDSGVAWLPAPRQLLCNHALGNHHFLLNPSQYLTRPFKNATAKYCKFAYSSAFTFSLAVGNAVVGQLAPDNALLLSRDGTETWATKKTCTDASVDVARVVGRSEQEQNLAAVSSRWFPWVDRSVSITTTLIPPSDRWPDWHVRIHRISVLGDGVKSLELIEGGFAVHGRRKSDGKLLTAVPAADLSPESRLGVFEGVLQSHKRVAIFSTAGSSGISVEAITDGEATTAVFAVKPEANTNLSACRGLCPVVQHSLTGLAPKSEVVLVTKVFAISSEANGGRELGGRALSQRWHDEPEVEIIGQPAADTAEQTDNRALRVSLPG